MLHSSFLTIVLSLSYDAACYGEADFSAGKSIFGSTFTGLFFGAFLGLDNLGFGFFGEIFGAIAGLYFFDRAGGRLLLFGLGSEPEEDEEAEADELELTERFFAPFNTPLKPRFV